MPQYLKLTEEIAEDIKARVKTLDFKTVEKLRKAKEQNGTFDVIISTEALDRAGEIVRQDGWDLANYKNNPIVLWGHDYYSLPIGICTETYNTTFRGVPALGARGVFLSDDINPFAQQVRRMYEYGVKSGYNVGCTTSVGFIPKEFDPDNRSIITRAELLEFSFVPVPANQGVGPAVGRSLTFEEAKEIGLDVAGMRVKGVQFSEIRGYVPEDLTNQKAADNTTWKKPTLADFTDKKWEDLSDEERTRIAGNFAYAKDNPAASFADLKLPHHRASDGAVVWHGVRVAMTALMGTRGGIDVQGDRKAVYDHLAAHYKEFGKQAPEFVALKEAQAGDRCTMDDGAPGVLTTDPNDPDGPLVCLPEEQDKSVAHASQKALLKALSDEHSRHAEDVDKAFDDFREKAAVVEDQGDPVDANKSLQNVRQAIKDLRTSLSDEHIMHRAKTVACFREFDPSADKAFDKNTHLKALRSQHEDYETKCNRAIDDFEDRCMKSVQGEPGSVDEHTDWVTGRMDANHLAHKKAVTKIAKKMCNEAFGEEDQADEKTLAILKEYLTPHIDAQLLPAVAAKIGTKLAAERKAKLVELYDHLKAASAVVETLHGGLKNDDGEESRSDSAEISTLATAPKMQRSRPTEGAPADDGLDAHLFARGLVREITTVAQRGLAELNKRTKH